MKGLKLLKKAQGATEYLIILAVVIIIALVVVGVMGGIPGIGTGGQNRANTAYWGTQNIGITSVIVSGTTATLKVRNNFADTITIQAATLTDSSAKSLATLPQTITAGQQIELTATVDNCAAGSSYDYAVNFTYSIGSSGNLTLTGGGVNLQGPCST